LTNTGNSVNLKTMKIQTVYKVTTKACQSCLFTYSKTPQNVKDFLVLSYSTSTWTIPHIALRGSGIFVFKNLQDVKRFLNVNIDCLHGDFLVWEAHGMNVRQQRKFINLNHKRTIEHLFNFWNLKCFDWLKSVGVKIKNSRDKGYYIADAVKLIKQVEI
jgi:hypothetical protein